MKYVTGIKIYYINYLEHMYVMYILQKHVNIIDVLSINEGEGDFVCQYLSRVQIFFFHLSS